MAVALNDYVLALLAIIALLSGSVLAQGTISICSAGPITSLRPCAQYCIANASFGPDNTGYCDGLAKPLACGSPASKIRNDCFCRPDLASSAHSILSTCINYYCATNAIDVAMAISVYDNYCAGAGVTVNPALTAVTAVTSTIAITTGAAGGVGGVGGAGSGGSVSVRTATNTVTQIFVGNTAGSVSSAVRNSRESFLWQSLVLLFTFILAVGVGPLMLGVRF